MIIKSNQNLYSPNRLGSKPRTKTGFANAATARKTLKNIAHFDMAYQKQVVITMYNRARYHPHRTAEMLKAMKVYASWMKKHDIRTTSTSRYTSKSRHTSRIKTKSTKSRTKKYNR